MEVFFKDNVNVDDTKEVTEEKLHIRQKEGEFTSNNLIVDV